MKQLISPRAQKAQHFILKSSLYLEIVVAIVLIIAILIAFLKVPGDLYDLFLDNDFELNDFIIRSFELVIGVELLKMFCRHDLDSVVEVLLFAVARKIVIEHNMPINEALIGIIAIAILFAIRRFLFVSALDDVDKAEEKLMKDDYIKQKVAEAIANYRKEHPQTPQHAESSVHTAEPAPAADNRSVPGSPE